MSSLGSGDNGELTFLDLISLMSFFIGVMNLSENLTQGDKQELQEDLSQKADLLLEEIHGHLEEQDSLLKQILEELRNDSRGDIQEVIRTHDKRSDDTRPNG